MDPLLLSLFERTTLTDKQRKAYLALLQLGNATITQIAELAQLKRTNTYGIVAELEVLGYAHPVMGGKKKTYAAADPSKLVNELKQNTQSLEEMLPYLRAIQSRRGKPYVQYYSSTDGAEKAFSQIYRPKESRYLSSIDRAQQAIPSEVARWKKIYLSGKVRPKSRHMLTDTPIDRVFGELLEKNGQPVRYLKPEIELNVDIALIDDKVFLTSFEDGVHISLIKSEATSKALSALFDLAWSSVSGE